MANETSSPIHNDPHVEDEAPEAPISVPDAGESGEGGKLKMIVSLVKKCLGVKDIAAMRLSLPASLLEPIPNLEYWHYLDRPDMFSAINDSEDQFERTLAVLRYTFTKDLKFVHGKVCKPYNSVLGEHFRAHWDVFPLARPEDDCSSPMPVMYTTAPSSSKFEPTAVSETGSVKSSRSSKSIRSGLSSKPGKSPSTAPTSPQPERADDIAGHMSNLNLTENGETSDGRLRVVYVTEQVSHHPPVSAYFATCPARSLELYGIDQISAKVSGTTVRVLPGQYNQGLYVNITGGHGAGEQYHITHPTASVNGILKGSFYVTVSDSTVITCTGGNHAQQFRAVIEYKEESWFGRPHFLLEGVIHTVHDGETQHEQWTKVKHVPHSRVVAVFDGTWRGQIRWRRVGLGSYPEAFHSAASSPSPSHLSLPTSAKTPKSASKFELSKKDDEYATLIDLSTLQIVPKSVRAVEKQFPHESRKLWSTVTTNLLKREFGEATKEKIAIEQKQRDHAADRKKKGVEFVPRYFEQDMSKGWSALTAEGKKAVEEELKEDSAFCIEGTEAELYAAGDS